jgi:hypothetical protein
MKRMIAIAMIAGLSLSLGGCKQSGKTDESGTSAAKTDAGAEDAGSESANTDDAWSEKVQAYIEIGNRMRGFLSAQNETFAEWRARDAEKVKQGDFKSIRTDSHYFSESDIKNLKDALAMSGKTPELDKAANALVAAIDKYMPNWNSLQDYNKAKRYEDDAGAKGKEMLPQYVEGIAAIENAAEELSSQIDAAAKVQHEKAVAEFKKDGKLLEMHTWEALGSAEKVIDMFGDAEDFKDQAKIKQADGHIATMETNIESLKKEYAKRKAEDAESLPMIDRYDTVISELNELAGAYRESRKDPSKFNDAVGSYNDAVDALNMMNR